MHFWNIYGGGLVGEFNVWDVNCPKLREEWQHLQSTTALRGNSEDSVLLTGTSTGYIQVRGWREREGVERGESGGGEGGKEGKEGSEGVEEGREWRRGGRGGGEGVEKGKELERAGFLLGLQ